MTQAQRLPAWKCLNGTSLKLIAMVCMLTDHAGSLLSDHFWLNIVGRIAFPIFAFQITEGYAHTSNFKTYLKRLFLFGLISELPYNMMVGGILYPFGQNVMFTFCISLLVIRFIDTNFQKGRLQGVLALLVGTLAGYLLGIITFVDYGGYGVLMVLGFWFFRRFRFGWFAQTALMVYINCIMIQGLNFTFFWQGREIWVPIQAFAVLAMIPIGLYNGQKGPGGRKFQYAVYAFYPLHILILVLIAVLVFQ